jgi:hypothetical protein
MHRLWKCIIVILLFFSCKDSGTYKSNVSVENALADTNTYIITTKDSLTSIDSFHVAFYWRLLIRAFNEEDFGVKQPTEDLIRFAFFEDYNPVLVTFKKGTMVVKEVVEGYVNLDSDTSKLSDIERLHYKVIFTRLIYRKPHDKLRRFDDSLVKVYPKLLDPHYYKYLELKAATKDRISITYKKRTVNVPNGAFQRIMDAIGRSGFWKLPYEVKCQNIPSDVSSYTIEVNKAGRYKINQVLSCPDDSTKLNIACQEIVKLAGLSGKADVLWTF